MKQKLQIIIGAVAAVLAVSAPAQDMSTPKTVNQDHLRHPSPNRLNDAAKASDVIGMTVKNYQDQKLGKVEDLAVDVESGRVAAVIVSAGGKLTAVPPGALQHEIAHQALLLDADREKLKDAPNFEMSRWDEGCDSNHLSEVYRYYGEQPYFAALSGPDALRNADVKRYNELPKNMDGTVNTTGTKVVEQTRDAETVRRVEETPTVSTRNPDGTWTREYQAGGAEGNSAWSRLGYVQKASKLKGTVVKNLQDEKLGNVENILVDLPSGRIVAVIIGSGGFLGMRGELSAVPPAALRFNPNHDTLQLDVSKETLAAAPHFKANQWPDLGRPEYTGKVYRAYRVDPYFAADMTDENGNAVRTTADHDERALTPMDQGNNRADIEITSQIRKEIIADNGMSVNARNVKIITANGRVTLRGAVNSDAEKRVIGEIANRIANAANVDNQLAVNNPNNN